MNQHSPFDWIINRFTYLQIYLFICFLFFLSLLPIGYFWIMTHLDRIHLIEQQINELQDENVLKNLFSEIQQHRLVTQRFLKGFNDERWELEKLDNKIRVSFQTALTVNNVLRDR
ncbi:MAG: hypothetical protein O7C60_05690 [Rickettsia endosymbiont of Ixodes persulcatus]|nr:hypothetical protein [Rickettsia endosymbiont of Ixodes persulcatus]